MTPRRLVSPLVGGALALLCLALANCHRPPETRHPQAAAIAPVDQPTVTDTSALLARLPATAPAEARAMAAALNTFAVWADTYDAAFAAERPALLAAGIEAARARRPVLKHLIVHDPELALRLALPPSLLRTLPPAVTAHLETPVATTGRYTVDIACAFPTDASSSHNHNHDDDALTRVFTTAGGTAYAAHVYGRRLDLGSKRALPVHGIALDDALAIHASPLRRLDPAEFASLFPAVTAQPSAGIPYLLGGDLRFAPTADALLAVEEHILAAESALGPDAPSAASPWSQGAKTMLYIRVAFADSAPGYEPLTLAQAQSYQNQVATFYAENSGGQTTLATTFTPTLVLPQPESYYDANSWTVLLDDARAAALAAGYPSDNYTFHTVATKKLASMSWAGRAFIGESPSHLNGDFALRVAAHEFGHNFGLHHANYNYTPSEHPAGRDAYPAAPENSPMAEYGHRYHMMGASGTTTAYHFSAREKVLFDWIAPADALHALSSGVHRLYRHDSPSAAGLRSLRIGSGDQTRPHYWLSYRRLFPSNTHFSAGAEVIAGKTSLSSGGNVLLDMTPYSNDGPHSDSYQGDNNDKTDAALVLGRMFGSPDSGAWATILDQGGAAPAEYLDVAVEVGNFSKNHPPVPVLSPATATLTPGQSLDLSASATDPDGDSLVYAWDFGDGTFAGNQPTVSKIWNTTGHYVVRCLVVDKKGGYSSARCVVRVGSPTTFTVSGRVTLPDGTPVEGARVHNGRTGSSYRGSHTDSQGHYTLPNIAAGAYTLDARKHEHSFAPDNFTNAVEITADITSLDFVATAAPAPFVLLDNADSAGVAIEGAWNALDTASGFYASDYLTDGNTGKGSKQITFTPVIPVTGNYRVYFRYAQSSNRATNAPVHVFHQDGVATTLIDQTTGGGAWRLLGTYAFAAGSAPASGSVRIRTTDTDGHVSADAVKFEFTTDQSPTFRLEMLQPVGSELGLTPATVRILREGPQDFPLTVHLAATSAGGDGAATLGADFTAPPADHAFAADQSTLDVAVAPLADILVEGPETFTLALRPPPGPTQDWEFSDATNTTLDLVANSVPGGVSWSASIPDSLVTSSGNFRIRRTGSGSSSSWAALPAPFDSAAPVHLVVEIASWTFTGTSPNEAVRLGFTTGVNSNITAQAVITRDDTGVFLAGEANGTGGTPIAPAQISTSINSSAAHTVVVSVFPATATYRVSYRQGTDAFTHLGTATLAPDRAPAVVRLSVSNSFASNTAEKFDLARISVAPADPTAPAYVIATPSEVELTIADDPRDDWVWRRFPAASHADPAIVGWTADPDADGLSNLHEYAFGRDPLLSDSVVFTTPTVADFEGSSYLTLSFNRRTDDPRITYDVEATGDLLAPVWPDTAVLFGEPTPSPETGYEEATYRDPVSLDTAARRFLRVRANFTAP